MANAEDVLQETRSVLRETEGRIRSHPFIADLAAGRVSLDDFRACPGHQYHMWKTDQRSAANLVARFGDRSYASFFRDDLQAEIDAAMRKRAGSRRQLHATNDSRTPVAAAARRGERVVRIDLHVAQPPPMGVVQGERVAVVQVPLDAVGTRCDRRKTERSRGLGHVGPAQLEIQLGCGQPGQLVESAGELEVDIADAA